MSDEAITLECPGCGRIERVAFTATFYLSYTAKVEAAVTSCDECGYSNDA